jgi:hypothetical protein
LAALLGRCVTGVGERLEGKVLEKRTKLGTRIVGWSALVLWAGLPERAKEGLARRKKGGGRRLKCGGKTEEQGQRQEFLLR